MKPSNFKIFFNGYVRAVLYSLICFYSIFILSLGMLNWFVFVYIIFGVVASILHFLFVLGLYIVAFPVITTFDINGKGIPFRAQMNRYTPIIAVPFAILFGLLWMTDSLNKYIAFVSFDILFTCYISLYFYIKNNVKIYESSQN